MLKLLLVGMGGFAGSISRYAISGMLYQFVKKPWFPYGTLTVNVIGCFFIGFLGGLVESRQVLSPEMRSLIFIGFLGGFTTFSTFGYEIFTFTRDGQVISALINLLLHLVWGLGAVWLGFCLSKLF